MTATSGFLTALEIEAGLSADCGISNIAGAIVTPQVRGLSEISSSQYICIYR